MSIIKSRIAPTPSGFLHKGNALNFLLTQKLAREAGAALRLRIDDLDQLRIKRAYVDDVFDTLAWLGIDYDEGPRSTTEQSQKYSQQLRLGRYKEMIDQLVKTGLVFACICTRKEIAFNRTCTCRHKNLPLDMGDVAWRIYTPDDVVISFEDGLLGDENVPLADYQKDFVIRRRDGLAAYQVTSMTDDLDYGINLVVRGEDLITSTAAQIYLAGLLGEEAFISTRFYHHRLIKDDKGEKLSKSAGSASLKWMRENGVSVASLRERLADNSLII